MRKSKTVTIYSKLCTVVCIINVINGLILKKDLLFNIILIELE